jgi:predicted glycosyltransferase involved in capsule biosynthesis
MGLHNVVHPQTLTYSFELYQKEWLADLRGQLQEFVSQHVRVIQPSRLSEMIQIMEEAKTKEVKLMKKHQNLQADYHNLISISSELISVLAGTISGKEVRTI